MRIHRAYKTELKLNNKQKTLLARCAGTARYAYNWGLRIKIDEYEATGKSPGYYELHRRLNGLKKTELSWMYEVSKTIPQEALRDLDRAFQNFFRRLKSNGRQAGEKPGFPRFKSRHRGLGSFRVWGAIRVEAERIKLPRLGWLRLKERGYLPAEGACPERLNEVEPVEGVKILSATVSERAGRWFVSLQVEEELPETTATGVPLGVDLGVTTMAVCSNGDRYENPKALTRALKRLARLQRELDRREKGSRNRARSKARLAKLHLRIANIRRNASHQATSAIVARTKPDVERPSVIVMEELHVAGMMKNHNLARAIADVGMGEFGRQLAYKATWSGSRLVKANRWFPSSKQCSRCHQVKEILSLSERVYHCAGCGQVMDRDLNAAINLMQLSTASSAGFQACGEVAVAAL
jgi:putative transposase